MEWVRGALVGRGSFASVSLATAVAANEDHPRTMAVKSTALPKSFSLRKEKEILLRLRDCHQILTCFGDDVTVENGNQVYNLFLEYVSGGTLADVVKKSAAGLPESDVRRFARSILRGLSFIHASGYVHCDIKLQNLLVYSSSDVRIADFGLAKEAGERTAELRGTPLYMSPELVARGECDAPSDIWSFGCAVSEMVAGKPPWRCSPDADIAGLLFRIGFTEELPEIPLQLSEEGRDFLRKCFVRDPAKRWTAEMLLKHPFLDGSDETIEEYFVSVPSKKLFESPRSAFHFPQWNSSTGSTCSSPSDSLNSINGKSKQLFRESNFSPAPASRIQQLAIGREAPNWFSSSGDDWVSVRAADSDIRPLMNVSSKVETSDVDDHVLVLEKMVSGEGQREEIPSGAEPPEVAPCSIEGTFESLSSGFGFMSDQETDDPSFWCTSRLCRQQPLFSYTGLAMDHKRRSCNSSSEQFDCHSSSEFRFLGRNDNNICINSFSKKYKIDLGVSDYFRATTTSDLFAYPLVFFFPILTDNLHTSAAHTHFTFQTATT
ncbi:mitogen-activated protein kinase kinase kinase 20-like [Aristolochia californica]|uniref:mitogen-activated protein kinase kinase kinase 20-like n=1 Tax=Aristolochia californica TaxID=171875 RepID=UPI0035D751D9